MKPAPQGLWPCFILDDDDDLDTAVYYREMWRNVEASNVEREISEGRRWAQVWVVLVLSESVVLH